MDRSIGLVLASSQIKGPNLVVVILGLLWTLVIFKKYFSL